MQRELTLAHCGREFYRAAQHPSLFQDTLLAKTKKTKKTRLDSATLLGYGRVYRELAGVGDRVQLAKDRLDR